LGVLVTQGRARRGGNISAAKSFLFPIWTDGAPGVGYGGAGPQFKKETVMHLFKTKKKRATNRAGGFNHNSYYKWRVDVGGQRGGG